MAAWRGIFGALGLVAVMAVQRRQNVWGNLRGMGWLGWLFIVQSAAGMIFYLSALTHTSVANVAVIYATAPFLAAALGWAVLREKPSTSSIIASLTALVGVAFMVGFGHPGGLSGDLLALGMTWSMASTMVVARHYREIPILLTACIASLLSGLFAWPFGAPFTVSGHELLLLALFGIVNFAIGLPLFTFGARVLPAIETALIGAVDAPLAPLWVWLFFSRNPRHEHADRRHHRVCRRRYSPDRRRGHRNQRSSPSGDPMTTRRHFLTAAGLFAAGATIAGTTIARAQQSCAVFTKETQAATTPEQALARLKEGNARVLAGQTIHCNVLAQIKDTAQGQAPFAAVLGCMDSRVAPELVFDQRIGDIFSVRIAGNFVNTDILGSLEYATKVAGAKLIVVLGHSECGAVKGAIDNVELGNLTAALENIRPAVLEIAAAESEREHTSKDKQFVQHVADRNAKDAAAMLVGRSNVLAALVKDHKLKIVSAMHDVGTGTVTWLT